MRFINSINRLLNGLSKIDDLQLPYQVLIKGESYAIENHRHPVQVYVSFFLGFINHGEVSATYYYSDHSNQQRRQRFTMIR